MGINGTIFAYGQTGAGKTYSIMGTDEEELTTEKRGVLPRTLEYIFERKPKEARLFATFFEIYNEKIYDLLVDPKKRRKLDIREESGQFSVPDLKKVELFTKEDAFRVLSTGISHRATSSTSLNSQSSRSHSLFQLHLHRDPLQSTLRIVDLAGSEKFTLRKDLPEEDRRVKIKEVTSINKSLSALGQCISALAEGEKRRHIPYRNAKLTKVLKDCLDENSNVSLIICVSPSVDSYKETLSTL